MVIIYAFAASARIFFANVNIFDEQRIIERIRLLREQFAGPRGKSEFARALGISASTYNYYEADRVPPVEILVRICQVTGADLNWLVTGSPAEREGCAGPHASLFGRLSALLEQRPETAEAVAAFVDLLAEAQGCKTAATQPARQQAPMSGWIPVLGRTAAGIVHFWHDQPLPEPQRAVVELDELVEKHVGRSPVSSDQASITVDLQARGLLKGLRSRRAGLVQIAGEGEHEIVEFVDCEDIRRLFPDSFALRIDGDSMSPRINDDDVVVVSTSVRAADGQVAIAHLAGQIGVTCKLIRTTEDAVHLIPINEKYETRVVPKKELLWALTVLCHLKLS